MPPRGHSSSSRSSRPSSSSRSSSSRSSSGFSRSSSSRSSSYRSFSSSGPRSHSSSSRSSKPSFQTGSSAQRQRSGPVKPIEPPRRPRTNQPIGFIVSGLRKPSYYYGRRHDYVYYPESWTDETTGTSYEKGYYDENGQYYNSVAFPKDGKYENVVCHCPYCDQNTVLNLTAEDATSHNLQCPHCGGPMEIESELDDYVGQTAENTHTYASEESLRRFSQKPKKKRRWWIVVAVLLAIGIAGQSAEDTIQENYVPQVQQIQEYDAEGFGDTILLKRTGRESYTVVSGQTGDKELIWDPEAESYYDDDTDCWLWYNTDVEPALWQYWYEGISSDYEESGWMEHDFDGWYIEAYEGEWIELPEYYDASELWFIG